jgi:hypothetical protein
VNLIDAQIAGTDWTITSPNGAVVATPGTLDTPGVTVVAEAGLAGVRLTGAVVTDGTWTIDVANPPARPRVSLAAELTGTYEPAELRVAETATIPFTFTDAFTNQPASVEDYQIKEIDVQARTGQQSTPLTCTPATDAVAVSCSFTPEQVGTATIDAAITIATADEKTPFTTEFTGSFDQPVLPAATFPRVAPDTITLSNLDGKRGTANGEVIVVGPEEGSGQVCFPDVGGVRIDSDVVDRSASYTFTSTAWGQCLTVAAGEQIAVPLSVTNPVPATGTVQASFEVELRSDTTDATYPQAVAVSFDTIRQGTPPWWLLLLLVVAGVGIPLALLYAQSLAASRLAMKGLRMAAVPVTVTMQPQGARVERARAAAESSTLTTIDDWQYLPTSLDRPRTARVAEGVTLAALTPRWPLSPLRAQARAPQGARVVTDAGMTSDGLSAPLSLAPSGQWILLARDADLTGQDPEEGVFPGTLIAFVSGSADANEMSAELTTQVRTSEGMLAWPGIIRAVARQQPAAGTPSSAGEEEGATPADPVRPRDEWDQLMDGPASAEQATAPGTSANPPGGGAPPPPPRKGARFDEDDPFGGI